MTTATVDNDAQIGEYRPVGPADAGRYEVLRCRRDPRHRGRSLLRSLTAGPGLLVALRTRIVRSSVTGRISPRLPRSRAGFYEKIPLLGGVLRRFLRARDSIVFYCAAVEEAGGWKAFRQEFALRVPVLCYHHVGAKAKGSWPLLTLSPAVFEEQMRWLADRGYAGISASDWLAWLERGAPLPEKPVVLTFDDAYSDLVQTALPILREHRFRATLFPVSQYIGGASTWDAGLGYPSRPLMSETEILHAMQGGITIGSHTRTHRNLRQLADAELKTELELSRTELIRLTGDSVRTLAYPFGSENPRVRACAAKFYDLAFGCRSGLNGWASDRGGLRRMFVYRNGLNFVLQVKYGIDLYAMYRLVPDKLRSLWRRIVPRTGSQGNAEAGYPQTAGPIGPGKADLV